MLHKTKKGKKILLIGNCYTTVAGFRKELVVELVRQGYDVYVSFPNHSHGESEKGEEFAEETGCSFIEIKINRRTINIFDEFIELFKKRYTDQAKIMIPENVDEFKECLERFIEERKK